MPASLYDRIAVTFLYNTSKNTFPHFIPSFEGELGGAFCKQVGGQARLPCSSPRCGEVGMG